MTVWPFSVLHTDLPLVLGQSVYVWTHWWACWAGGWWAPEWKPRWNPSGRAAGGQGSCTTSAWPEPSPDVLCCPLDPEAAGPAACSAAAEPADTQTHSRTQAARPRSRTQWPSGSMGPRRGWRPLPDRLHHQAMISFVCALGFRGCHRGGRRRPGCCSYVCHSFVHPWGWPAESYCECGHDGTGRRCSDSAGLCSSCWQQIWAPRGDHELGSFK